MIWRLFFPRDEIKAVIQKYEAIFQLHINELAYQNVKLFKLLEVVDESNLMLCGGIQKEINEHIPKNAYISQNSLTEILRENESDTEPLNNKSIGSLRRWQFLRRQTLLLSN